MFDFWVSSRMEFSIEGKRACFDIVKTIARLAEKANQGGIQTLKSELEATDNKFFKAAIRLLVDGITPEDTRKILQNYIIVGNYRGRALFGRILAMEGIIAIQRGFSPKFILEELLASYFGEDFLPEYNEFLRGIYESAGKE